MPKYPPTETHIFHQLAVDFRDAALSGVDQYVSRHAREHLLDTGWRAVIGPRTKFQPQQSISEPSQGGGAGNGPVVFPKKSVGQSGYDPPRVVSVFLFLLALLV